MLLQYNLLDNLNWRFALECFILDVIDDTHFW